MSARVTDLQPGVMVALGGMSAVFIVQAERPVWPVLRLVVWRLGDGTVSLDALSADQEVGEVAEAGNGERYERLVDAVRGQE